MKKQKRQMIVLLVFLLAMVGGYLGLRAAAKKEDAGKYSLIKAETTAFTQLDFTNSNGDFSLKKVEDTWKYEGDEEQDANVSTVDNMLEQLSDIHTDDRIENVTDYEQYGLSEPEVKVTATYDGNSTTLLFGNYNSAASKLYCQIEGQPEVYLIDSSPKYAFEKKADDLIQSASSESSAGIAGSF